MLILVTREQIVAEAMGWTGTPWHHHQSCKGVGTDCVGLLFGVGKAIGVLPPDTKLPNYERLARGKYLVRQLESWLSRTDEYLPGNVVLIRIGGLDTHVGILIGRNYMIHASPSIGQVVISPLTEYGSKVVAIYSLPGVAQC